MNCVQFELRNPVKWQLILEEETMEQKNINDKNNGLCKWGLRQAENFNGFKKRK